MQEYPQLPTELWLTILYNLLEGGKMVLRMRFLNKTFAEAARLHEDNIFPEVTFSDSLFSPAEEEGRVKQKMHLAKEKKHQAKDIFASDSESDIFGSDSEPEP